MSAVTPAVAYSVPADVEPAPIETVVLPVVSHAEHGNIVVALLHVATANAGVPPLAAIKIQMRNAVVLEVPSVAPFGIVIDKAAEVTPGDTVPSVNGVALNSVVTGLPAVAAEPDA